MKHAVVLTLSALLVFLAPGAARAEFQLTPIDPEFRDRLGPIALVRVHFAPDVQFDRVPDGATGEVKFGRFAPDGVHILEFAVYSSSGGGRNPDTLVFDVNGDKDLTNDAQITGFTRGQSQSVTVPVPGGGTMDMKIALSRSSMRVESNMWLKGTVKLDGKPLVAALFDGNGAGIGVEGGRDYLFLDLDGNAIFDFDLQRYDIAELLRLQPELLVRGRLYTADFDAAKPDLTLTPFEGPQGKLALDLRFPRKLAQCHFTGYVIEEERMNVFSARLADFPIAMKAGEIILCQGMLMLTDESGKHAVVVFSVGRPISIAVRETTVLTVGDHEGIDVSVIQKGDKLAVDQSLVSKSGIKYDMIMLLPEDMDMDKFRPEGPDAKILDQNGQLLSQGSMEYG